VGDSKFNTANFNHISNNVDFGMNSTSKGGYIIEATYNWWGDTSGPYHSENNSMGRGDNVTDFIDFNPWIGEKGDTNEDDEDSIDPWILNLLILILLLLFGILSILIISVTK